MGIAHRLIRPCPTQDVHAPQTLGGFDIPVIILTTFDDHELVLQGIRAGAKGYLLKDVSRETSSALSKSEGTVKNHVSNILSKLGVRDRTRAVLRAIEIGLI